MAKRKRKPIPDAAPDGVNNLDYFHKFTDTLTNEERQSFECFFVGRLSAMLMHDVWREAVDGAAGMVRRKVFAP